MLVRNRLEPREVVVGEAGEDVLQEEEVEGHKGEDENDGNEMIALRLTEFTQLPRLLLIIIGQTHGEESELSRHGEETHRNYHYLFQNLLVLEFSEDGSMKHVGVVSRLDLHQVPYGELLQLTQLTPYSALLSLTQRAFLVPSIEGEVGDFDEVARIHVLSMSFYICEGGEDIDGIIIDIDS